MTQQPTQYISTTPPTEMSDQTPSAPAEQVQLLSLPELGANPAEKSQLVVSNNPLLDVRAQLQICVGEAVISVGELLNAKLNQVVALDRAVDDLVDVLLEGRLVARGQLVAVGDNFGVRLTELPVSLRP